jgi:hypothetical protein
MDFQGRSIPGKLSRRKVPQ